MVIKEITTAAVVDCPTPLAPPLVVKPQLQPIMATEAPKIADFIIQAITSQVPKKVANGIKKNPTRNIVQRLRNNQSSRNTHHQRTHR